MSTLALSRHARERIVEFGLTLDVVAQIASRPDVTHRNAQGQTVCTADRHPDWTVVLGHDDVVVTVLRRLRGRWEHGAPAARPVVAAATRTVEDRREIAAPVARRSRRRAVPPPPPSAVVRRAVDPDALRLATELADGDLRRLVLNADGSVTILNRARSR